MSTLINNRSPDQILNDIVATFQALQPDVSVNEASVIYILAQVYAFVSSLNVATAQEFALAAFIATSDGDNLTALASDRGIDRILGTKSSVLLTFSRITPDYVYSYTIPASTNVSTQPDENGDYYQYTTYNSLTITASSMSVTGYAQADTIGAVYNVVPNTITNFINVVNGVDSVTNLSDAYGGTDDETDEELRARISVVLSSNASKTTVSGYQNTLIELGCKSAYVYSPTGTMPNYITAVVTSPNTATTVPTTGELAYWQTQVNLDSNRAVADVITVTAPSTVTITVSAKITEYEATANTADTLAGVKTAVINYINALSPDGDVYVNNIRNVIHDYSGVKDYTLYLPTTNTTITQTQKAIADTSSVTIT